MEMPDKFEQEWREAFENAEMPPNPIIWDKVELAMANSANGSFKKRLLFFKLMAAASVAFALTIGGIGIYKEFYIQKDDQLLSSRNNNKESLVFDDNAEVPNESTGTTTLIEDSIEDNKDGNESGFTAGNEESDELKSGIPSLVEDGGSDNEIVANNDMFNMDTAVGESNLMEDDKNTNIYEEDDQHDFSGMRETVPKKIEKLMEELESFSFADPELAMVPWYSAAAMDDKNLRESSGLWAGLGMTGGSFNPTGGIGSLDSDQASFSLNEDSFTQSAQSPLVGKEENGRTINIGFNIGTKIAPKWIIQSGVVLIERSTTNTSNIAQNAGSALRAVNDFSEVADDAMLSVIDTYEIDNSYRFISVPVQAGYLLFDRKLAITLLGGVSNDLFIKKSVDGERGGFEEYNVDEGIRKYNISGLLGTEVGYRLGDHYLIAITPQLRQAINSTTISGEAVRPTFFELGFRFKYLLK